MKRKESLEKTKPNKDLAHQLKARLFDKGRNTIIKVLAMVHSLQSRDRSKIITNRPHLKIMHSLLHLGKIRRIIR